MGVPVNNPKIPDAWTNGWNRGYPCKVKEVTNYQLICVTASMNEIPEFNGLGFPAEFVADHINKTQFLDFETIWNYQVSHIYVSKIRGTNCS